MKKQRRHLPRVGLVGGGSSFFSPAEKKSWVERDIYVSFSSLLQAGWLRTAGHYYDVEIGETIGSQAWYVHNRCSFTPF